MASTDRTGSTLDPDAIVQQALAMRDAGRAEEGIPAIQAALRRWPHDARLWQVLGLLHRAIEDCAAATDALREAARLAPGDARIAHAHARVAMEAGLPSLPLFERARRLAPLDGDLLISRAAAQLAEGRGREAIAEIDALLRTSPNWLQGQELLANMRWMLGERDKFTQGYERAIAAEPANLALWLALAARLMHADQYAALDEMLGRARRAAGPHLAFDANEAVCASELGDVARADALFDRLAAIPDDVFAIRHVRHLLRTGRPVEAARRAEPLTRGAQARQAWPYLAIAWRLTGDPRHEWLEGHPALIGQYDLAEPLSAIPGLVPLIRRLHTTVAHPVGQSVRGGTQTDGPLFRRAEPEILALRRLVERTVADHVRDWPHDPDHPTFGQRPAAIRFAGSWSVRLTGAGHGHHTNHIHPEGWLSSALYLAVPAPGDLGPAPGGWLGLGQPPAELGLDLPALRLVEPRFGRLVLFPSTMWHGTLPFGTGERLTVAFDVAG